LLNAVVDAKDNHPAQNGLTTRWAKAKTELGEAAEPPHAQLDNKRCF
jgi:hypothetical protein